MLLIVLLLLRKDYIEKFIESFEMNDRELKRYIEGFVRHHKDPLKPERISGLKAKPSQYCQAILAKKKLHQERGNKIAELLKDFTKTGNYVNVPQLHKDLKYIMTRIYEDKKKQAKNEEASIHQLQKKITETSEQNLLKGPNELKNKIKTLFGKKRQKFFNDDIQIMSQLIEHLNEGKNINFEELNNMRILENCNKEEQNLPKKKIDRGEGLSKNQKIHLTAKFNSEMEKLFEKATMYLLVILSNKHKQKWNQGRSSMHESFNRTSEKKQLINGQRSTFHSGNSQKQRNSVSFMSYRRSLKKPSIRLSKNSISGLTSPFQTPNKRSSFNFIDNKNKMNVAKPFSNRKKLKKHNMRQFYLNKAHNFIQQICQEQLIYNKDKVELQKYIEKIENIRDQCLSELKKILIELQDNIVNENFSFRPLNQNLSIPQ